MEKAKARALKRIVGDPFKKGVEQGPQVLFFRVSLSPLSWIIYKKRIVKQILCQLKDKKE